MGRRDQSHPTFHTPDQENDWVLAIDGASKKYKAPGAP